MKLILCICSWSILFVFLASCNSRPATLSIETPTPRTILPTPIPSATLIPAIVTPSPLPTQPITLIITPDPIQVEKWVEYQSALAKMIIPYVPPEEVLCEWEILGQSDSDQEVYVWAVCTSIFSIGNSGLFYNAGMPALIHIGIDGTVQSVEVPGVGSDYERDIRKMFPPNAQEKYFSKLINFQKLLDHLQLRLDYPKEPPLIILSSTPIP